MIVMVVTDLTPRSHGVSHEERKCVEANVFSIMLDLVLANRQRLIVGRGRRMPECPHGVNNEDGQQNPVRRYVKLPFWQTGSCARGGETHDAPVSRYTISC